MLQEISFNRYEVPCCITINAIKRTRIVDTYIFTHNASASRSLMRIFLVRDRDLKNFFYKPIIYAFPGCDA